MRQTLLLPCRETWSRMTVVALVITMLGLPLGCRTMQRHRFAALLPGQNAGESNAQAQPSLGTQIVQGTRDVVIFTVGAVCTAGALLGLGLLAIASDDDDDDCDKQSGGYYKAQPMPDWVP